MQEFVANRFKDGGFKEWPVHALDGEQIIGGRIDLLVELSDGYIVVDHKSFPGVIEVDGERLNAFAAQANLYARALREVTGKTCKEYWLHQPIAGLMTRVAPTADIHVDDSRIYPKPPRAYDTGRASNAPIVFQVTMADRTGGMLGDRSSPNPVHPRHHHVGQSLRRPRVGHIAQEVGGSQQGC